MNINGHGIRDHLQLLAPIFGLLAAVWALRLVLAAAGAPRGIVLAVSMTVAGPVCVLLAVLMIHHRRFGSYANVVAAAFLLICWQQLLIVGAIAFSALTGTVNVYSAPEFSFGQSPLKHIAGHLTFGIGFGTLSGAAMGALLLWMLRRTMHAGSHR